VAENVFLLFASMLRWFLLQFLRDYFHANGEGPVPLEVLQNQKYRDIVSIRLGGFEWDFHGERFDIQGMNIYLAMSRHS
jgi:hypothetical protein